MDNRVILQVPLPRSLKEQAEAVSADYGFSSLQEVIRVILNKLAQKKLILSIEEVEEITHLSPVAEKRYRKIKEDIKNGRNIYKPENTDEFFRLLRA